MPIDEEMKNQIAATVGTILGWLGGLAIGVLIAKTLMWLFHH